MDLRLGPAAAERLAGHDAALRILADVRTAAYDRLERLAPARFRSGDLISRLVDDIDSLADRWLRVRLPYAVAAVAAAGAAVCGALALGGPAVRSGSLAAVALAVVVLTPLAVHEVFGGLAPAAQQVPRLRSAAARVSALLTCPSPVTEPAAPAPVPRAPCDIRIEGLDARWIPNGRRVLADVNLTIRAGSTVAVTGPSGSGKTTLAMVLLRFLDPVAGRVTLGGTDITTLASDDARKVIGLCAQDAHIFDSTIARNLRLARPQASEAELRGALGRARLLDWVDSLPAGLDTPVGEHGTQLSGGQRQRLALARVLLADFPVVILDEPAEHLDEQTAAELTRDLLSATEGRTRVIITHRPVEPGRVDQVLRLVAPPPAACRSRQASKPPRPEQPLAAPAPTAGVTGSPGA